MTAATTYSLVPDLIALDRVFVQSAEDPALLFLHDPYCPLSAAAYRELARLGEDIALIDVAAGRDLSRTVEQRTGVRHESPQILILRGSRAVWSASHGRIRAATVAAALDEPEQGPPVAGGRGPVIGDWPAVGERADHRPPAPGGVGGSGGAGGGNLARSAIRPQLRSEGVQRA